MNKQENFNQDFEMGREILNSSIKKGLEDEFTKTVEKETDELNVGLNPEEMRSNLNGSSNNGFREDTQNDDMDSFNYDLDEGDPNDIIPYIGSKKPVVVFFGPKEIGKTAAIIRLSRFLSENGYKVEPDREFIPKDNSQYKNEEYYQSYQHVCNVFENRYLKNKYAPNPNFKLDFLLLKVLKGKVIFQLLEAPGEHYFNEAEPESPFKSYFTKIITDNKLPKIYTVFLQLDWKTPEIRKLYSQRVVSLLNKYKPQRDYLIILCNKADKKEGDKEFYNGDEPIHSGFKGLLAEQYPLIFKSLGRQGLRAIFQPVVYPHSFLAFSSGYFLPRAGADTYIESDDDHPQRLYNLIKRKGLR